MSQPPTEYPLSWFPGLTFGSVVRPEAQTEPARVGSSHGRSVRESQNVDLLEDPQPSEVPHQVRTDPPHEYPRAWFAGKVPLPKPETVAQPTDAGPLA
jgi:hypothetical protein